MKKLPFDAACREALRRCGLPETLLAACSYILLESGETVLQQGAPLDWLGILVAGHAKVFATVPSGKDLILLRYVSEGLIGDMEFAAGIPNAASTVVAVTELSYLRLPNKACKAILMAQAPFLKLLSAELAGKLLRSSNNYQSGVLFSGEERLCNYILQNARGDWFLEVLRDVSNSIGVSYRHLFRLLAGLCDDGILEKRANGYRICDRAQLILRAFPA